MVFGFLKRLKGENVENIFDINALPENGTILRLEEILNKNVRYTLVGVEHIPRTSSKKIVRILEDTDYLLIEDRAFLIDRIGNGGKIIGKEVPYKSIEYYLPKNNMCNSCNCRKGSKDLKDLKFLRLYILSSLLGLEAALYVYKRGLTIYGIDNKMGAIPMILEPSEETLDEKEYTQLEIAYYLDIISKERIAKAICYGLDKYLKSNDSLNELTKLYIEISNIKDTIVDKIVGNSEINSEIDMIKYYPREIFMAYNVLLITKNISSKKSNITIITGASHTKPLAYLLENFKLDEIVDLKKRIENSSYNIFDPYSMKIEEKDGYYKVLFKKGIVNL